MLVAAATATTTVAAAAATATAAAEAAAAAAKITAAKFGRGTFTPVAAAPLVFLAIAAGVVVKIVVETHFPCSC